MIARTPKDLGLLIRRARIDQSLTQSALARRLRTTQAWISEIERGKTTAQLGQVLRLLEVLGVSVNLRMATPSQGQNPDEDLIDAVLQATRGAET